MIFRLRLLVLTALLHATATAEPFQWGINGHPLTQEGYWQVPLDDQLDLVKESGATWYRISFGFDGYRANTERFEEILEKAEKRNLKLLPVLMPPKGFYDGSKPLAQIQEESAAFGKEMAGHYNGRITHWELGNELDAFAMIKKGEKDRSGKEWKWDGAPDGNQPDHYETTRYERCREFFKSLRQGIKEADPKALTMIDTAGWLHYGFLQRLKEDGVNDYDIVAWHWYSEMGPLTAASKDKIDVIKQLKDSFGKPIWLTEINRRDGSKNDNENTQAEYITQTLGELSKHPDIKAVFLYELLDEPYFGESGESDYGIAKISKESGKWKITGRKPAFDAFRKLTTK